MTFVSIHQIKLPHKLFISVQTPNYTQTAIHQNPCESSVAAIAIVSNSLYAHFQLSLVLSFLPFLSSVLFSTEETKKNVKNELVTHAITCPMVRGVMQRTLWRSSKAYQMGFVHYNWWSRPCNFNITDSQTRWTVRALCFNASASDSLPLSCWTGNFNFVYVLCLTMTRILCARL